MNRYFRVSDPILLFLGLLATFVGLLVIFDAGYARSLQLQKGIVPHEFIMQILYLPVALVLSAVVSRFHIHQWMRASKWLWLVTLIFLAAVMVPGLRYAMNGAHRWIKIGPLILQPAEFAKITAILYVAGVFAVRKSWPKNVKPARNWADYLDRIAIPKLGRYLPGVWVLVAVVMISKEPDLGTAFVIATSAFAIFWYGGATRRSLIMAIVLSFVGVGVLIKQEPYRLERIENHAQRWSDENMDDSGYQPIQSEIAMSSGGLAGVGIGAGRAKHVLPATTTDYIMATVGEEFGLLGSLMVLAILGAIVLRLIQSAIRAQSEFAKLVLCGTASWITVQSCVNVMMANGLLPSIGIPLPFISSGGSSLVALWVALGLCQSALSRRPVKEALRAPSDNRWGHRRPRLSRA